MIDLRMTRCVNHFSAVFFGRGQMDKASWTEYYNRAAQWARMVMPFSEIAPAVLQREMPVAMARSNLFSCSWVHDGKGERARH